MWQLSATLYPYLRIDSFCKHCFLFVLLLNITSAQLLCSIVIVYHRLTMYHLTWNVILFHAHGGNLPPSSAVGRRGFARLLVTTRSGLAGAPLRLRLLGRGRGGLGRRSLAVARRWVASWCGLACSPLRLRCLSRSGRRLSRRSLAVARLWVASWCRLTRSPLLRLGRLS